MDEYKESKSAINKEIASFKEEIKILNLKLKHADTQVGVERLSILKEFKEKLTQGNLSNEELNNLYTTIIDSIVWESNDIKIQINFL